MIGCWVIDKEEWEISTKALINQGRQTYFSERDNTFLTIKVATYNFTIARALGRKVEVICTRAKGNVSVFRYFITST